MKKRLLLLGFALNQIVSGFAQAQTNEMRGDTSKNVEVTINHLLSRMTKEEMISMIGGLGFETVTNPRLGIPGLVMIDGHAGPSVGTSTSFATSITMAATWNPDLVYQIGTALAEETKAKHCNTLLAPNINVDRVPQAGRNLETFGEDPFLIGRMSSAYIRGLQDNGIIATVKHFVCNNQETNRSFIDVKIDERTLNEIYFPGFKSAVQEGGALAVMCAYNRLNGQYAADNTYLLTDILKSRWRFKGIVMSDWGAVHSTIPAFYAGTDLEMPKAEYFKSKDVNNLLQNPNYEALLKDKVRRILRVIYSMKITDDEYSNVLKFDTAGHSKLSLKTSEEGIVLLKNSNTILPFEPAKIRSIAVIGPLANANDVRGVMPDHVVTTYQGIKKMAGKNVKVTYALGCDITDNGKVITKDDLISTTRASGIVMEYYDNSELEGSPVALKTVDQLSFSWSSFSPVPEIKTDKYSIRIKGNLVAPESGYYNFFMIMALSKMRLFISGKLVFDNWNTSDDTWTKQIDSIYLKKGSQIPCILEYQSNPHSYNMFSFSWKYLEKNPLEKAVALARASDAVVLCVGYSGSLENEDHDRVSIALEPAQEELIEAVARVNKDVIVVLNSGSAVGMSSFIDKVSAVVEQWHPGQEGGTALAELLFGEINPSGKLPVTFMRRWEDSPAYPYYPGKNGIEEYGEGINVGYRYYDRPTSPPALFTFGYGLSYTKFQISNLQLSSGSISTKDSLPLSVSIKNSGKIGGAEVVQIYIGQNKCSVDRPVKELKAFKKVFLEPGQKKTVSFSLKPDDFKYYDVVSHDWKVEPGTFTVYVGASSTDIRQRAVLEVKKVTTLR